MPDRDELLRQIGEKVVENIASDELGDDRPLTSDGFPQGRWEGYERCVVCGNKRPDGHTADCLLTRYLEATDE